MTNEQQTPQNKTHAELRSRFRWLKHQGANKIELISSGSTETLIRSLKGAKRPKTLIGHRKR